MKRRKRPFAYGFYTARRREQAILVQNVTAWKLRKLGSEAGPTGAKQFGYVRILRDISNAFPSMAHAAMEETLDQVAPNAKIARVLKHRHKQNWMIITTNSGDWVVLKPGTGGLQGDVFMPELFGATYEPQLQSWIGWKRQTVSYTHLTLPTIYSV